MPNVSASDIIKRLRLASEFDDAMNNLPSHEGRWGRLWSPKIEHRRCEHELVVEVSRNAVEAIKNFRPDYRWGSGEKVQTIYFEHEDEDDLVRFRLML